MSTLPKSFITPEQYLEIDRQAERKGEYYRGEMFAMAGSLYALPECDARSCCLYGPLRLTRTL
jgi:hypothetical protein